MSMYRMFKIEDIWPQIYSDGQIWSSSKLVQHQKESMSMYRKLKIKDSLA